MNAPTDPQLYRIIYGYTVGDVHISLAAPRSAAKITPHDLKTKVSPTAIVYGNYPLLVAMPMASTTDGRSAVAGCIKRCTSAMPTPNHGTLVDFSRFSGIEISKIEQVSADLAVSVRAWLAETSYSEKHKIRMVKEYLEGLHPCDDKEFNDVNQFVKNERFPEFKAPRLINAKKDGFKFHLGPIVKEVEKIIYKMPEFIKSIPVSDRPRYILDMIAGDDREYLTTDFTSFEANFTRFIMRCCENALLRHVFKNHPLYPKLDWLCKAIEGRQVCKSSLGYTMEVDATRMSGEMTTSLSNGFSNLMFMRFVFSRLGVTDLRIVVEGDDAIMSVPKGSTIPTEDDFAQLGLKVKLERHVDLCTASFCGLVFDKVDLINVTDPLATVVEMNILPARCAAMRKSKQMAYLKAKAMSAKYQYNGCPIVDAYASWILRATARFDHRAVLRGEHDWWDRQKYQHAFANKLWKVRTPTPHATRLVVQDKYDISVQHQIAIEHFFDSQTELAPWYFSSFHGLLPQCWADAWDIQTNPIRLPAEAHTEGLPLPSGQCSTPHLSRPPERLRHLFNPEMDGWLPP